MGLDGVELVMATEDEFGIQISDAEAEKMLTVGDLVDHVYENITGVSPERDRELKSQLDNKFKRFTNQRITTLPHETKVKSLLTPGKEVKQWRMLGLSPPAARPGWLIATAFSVLSVTGITWLVNADFPPLMSILVVIAAGFMTDWLTRPFYRLPKDDHTIGHLIWWRTEDRKDEVSRQVIFDKVKHIIVDQLGVTEDQVTEEARFVEDLGIG